jgi:hypothetical protein
MSGFVYKNQEEVKFMRRTKRFIACALSVAVIMSSAFGQGVSGITGQGTGG